MKRLDMKVNRMAGTINKLGRMTPPKRRNPLPEPDVPDVMDGVELDRRSGSIVGDPGKQAEVAVSATLKGFMQRRKDEQAQKELATDGAFYMTVIFETREQKIAFLAGIGMGSVGDLYVDGRMLADKLNIPIPEVKARMPRLFRVDKKLHDLT